MVLHMYFKKKFFTVYGLTHVAAEQFDKRYILVHNTSKPEVNFALTSHVSI